MIRTVSERGMEVSSTSGNAIGASRHGCLGWAAVATTAFSTHHPGSKVGLTGPVLDRIRSIWPSLSQTGTRVAEVVLAEPRGIVELTVSDLAARSNTSVGSVVRFCQDLDLRGYQDLKLRLAAETATANPPSAPGHGSPGAVVVATLAAASAGIQCAIDMIDLASLEPIVHALRHCSRVLLVGVGTSAPIAQDAAYRLRSHGVAVDAPADSHIQHVAARLLTPDMACLAVSHTGQTRETLTAVGAARDAGATTLAVTSFNRSPLTELCDHVVVAGAAETQHHLEARTSRLVHLAVIDALLAALTHADPERTRAAQELSVDAITDHRI